nr:phenylacetaldoxime dehydratase family protein [Tatumella sp. JGM118]
MTTVALLLRQPCRQKHGCCRAAPEYVQALNFKVALRLWHEIIVVPASAQHFEYINCHPDTGLLRQPDGRTL